MKSIQSLPVLLLLLFPIAIRSYLKSSTLSSLRRQRHVVSCRSRKLTCLQSFDGSDMNMPQYWISSVSRKSDPQEAVEEATSDAINRMPDSCNGRIDIAFFYVSSTYGNVISLRDDFLHIIRKYLPDVPIILGNTAKGVLGISAETGMPVEVENDWGLSLTIACLPGVQAHFFHIDPSEVPDGDATQQEWTAALNLPAEISTAITTDDSRPILLLSSAPRFPFLDDVLRGLDYTFPSSLKIGAEISTVSSAHIPILFSSILGERERKDMFYGEGVNGVLLQGDIKARAFHYQGARAVGPSFAIEKNIANVILSIRRAEASAKEKAISPDVAPMSEIVKLQQTLPMSDQVLMRRSLLLGLEVSEMAESVSDLKSMMESNTSSVEADAVIYKATRVDMKDGSVEIPKNVRQGQRFRIFVKDKESAIKEIDELVSQKREQLESAFKDPSDDTFFRTCGALFFPTADRGRLLFDEPNFETSKIMSYIPLPFGGFFATAGIGQIGGKSTFSFGSGSGLVLFSPKDARRNSPKTFVEGEKKDQQSSITRSKEWSNDVVIRRRDVNAARSLISGNVEYSVIENLGKAENRLESLVWEKETEIDRIRDRWPFTWILPRVQEFNAIAGNKARSLIASLKERSGGDDVAYIVECRQMDPVEGILRYEYDPISLCQSVTAGGAAAIAVAVDKNYGGRPEDIAAVRQQVDIPLIYDDIIIYPYQIYKARLNGADAIKLLVSVIPEKDLGYFQKIANSLGMDCVMVVNSMKQLETVCSIPGSSIVSIMNRRTDSLEIDGTIVHDMLSAGALEKLRDAGIDLVICEGVLGDRDEIARLKSSGIKVFSLGDILMKSTDPGKVLEELRL